MKLENTDFEEEAENLLSNEKELQQRIVGILEARDHKCMEKLTDKASKKGEKYSKSYGNRPNPGKSMHEKVREVEEKAISSEKSLPQKVSEVQEKAGRRAAEKRKKIDELNRFNGYTPDY